jgi:DNA-binding NarL/FixJ family response regulator
MQVADLIKEGKTTKEIAQFMNISRFAIDTHRAHLRKKLGLTQKKTSDLLPSQNSGFLIFSANLSLLLLPSRYILIKI